MGGETRSEQMGVISKRARLKESLRQEGGPPSGIVWELAWRLLRPATNLCLDRGSAGYKTYGMIGAYSEGRELSEDRTEILVLREETYVERRGSCLNQDRIYKKTTFDASCGTKQQARRLKKSLPQRP